MPEIPELPSDEDIRAKLQKVRDDLASNNGAGAELELELKADSMVSKISEAADTALHESPLDEIDTRLELLKQKAAASRAKHDRATKLSESEIASSSRNARASGLGLTVAYMIMGFPMAGAGVGWIIDRATGASTWMGILTTIGAVVGVAVTVAMVNKHSNSV